MLDLLGNGFRFTGLSETVSFDIDGDGGLETLTWTDPDHDEAFLALDRNGNGRIDDGTELFGNVTPQPPSPAPNGFRALAEYDLDGDGEISPLDPVYSSLLLWQDRNHDGLSQAWEMQPLASRVQTLSLDYATSGRRDRHGNLLRWTGRAEIDGRQGLRSADVVFRRAGTPRTAP